MSRLFRISMAGSLLLLLGFASAPSAQDLAKFGEAEFKCVAKKQNAAGQYSRSALGAWAQWEKKQNDARLDAKLARAGVKLAAAFGKAEAESAARGVDCVEQTASAAEIEAVVAADVVDVVAAINSGLDLSDRKDARCGARLLRASGKQSKRLLRAESRRTRLAGTGKVYSPKKSTKWKKAVKGKGKASKYKRGTSKLGGRPNSFAKDWRRARCGTDTGEQDVANRLAALSDHVTFLTLVSPALDDSEFQPVSPVGPIEYQGRTLNPRCGFDDSPDYHFFVKRGSVNKVVMYYQGGGACWEILTCGVPVCKNEANLVSDDPDNASAGFGDLSNPDNPFKDWNAVFVTYCTCDVHFGDSEMTYSGFLPDVNVSHRGYENAKVAEKFAREHFLNPDAVFVTGSSAGSYGALFHAPALIEAWPTSSFNVLGDGGNGVITPSFLQNEFGNWNFEANIPTNVPGALEAISSGAGMVDYIDAVADFYNRSTWAHYSTAYDGGFGGQTGFYNVMLNDSNPFSALSWWEGTCEFNEVMIDQAVETADLASENYRFYIGAGSQHTMYGNNKVYSDQSGGEDQTIVDWIVDMIAFDPDSSDPTEWQNVECTDCETVLPGDPIPPVTQTAPFFNDMGDTVIMCSE